MAGLGHTRTYITTSGGTSPGHSRRPNSRGQRTGIQTGRARGTNHTSRRFKRLIQSDPVEWPCRGEDLLISIWEFPILLLLKEDLIQPTGDLCNQREIRSGYLCNQRYKILRKTIRGPVSNDVMARSGPACLVGRQASFCCTRKYYDDVHRWLAGFWLVFRTIAISDRTFRSETLTICIQTSCATACIHSCCV